VNAIETKHMKAVRRNCPNPVQDFNVGSHVLLLDYSDALITRKNEISEEPKFREIVMFRRNMLPPSSGSKSKPSTKSAEAGGKLIFTILP
jgi:hypothetical protein